MNIDKIFAVADAIETKAIRGLGFNMAVLRGPAGPDSPDLTGDDNEIVRCLALWTVALFYPVRADDTHEGIMRDARDILGLSWSTASMLFTPKGYWAGNYSPEDAVKTLRLLATTGRVEWATEPALTN